VKSGESMARSRSAKGRRRKQRGRTYFREGAVGAAALAVLGLAVSGPLIGRVQQAPVHGTAEQAPPETPGRTPLIAADGGTERVLSGQRAPGAGEAAGTEPEKLDSGTAREPGADPGSGTEAAEPEVAGPDSGAKRSRDQGEKASGPSEHTDVKAAEYFQQAKGKAGKRVKDVRSVGGYLRIYTDLPESADNSSQAIELCRRGLKYLEEQGAANPVVFVQGEFGENGNPVLANILGPDDGNCRVTHPKPR
jgi:hypothetical protein